MIRKTKHTNPTLPPDAILCSDFHLREDTPICRTDDFWAAQWRKVQHIKDLQDMYNCPVIHAGDLFHHWKPSPRLLSYTVQHLPNSFYSVYGNHDLPENNMVNAEKSGLYTLITANVVTGFPAGGNWGQKEFAGLVIVGRSNKVRTIGIKHIFTYKGASPWPGCTSPDAYELLESAFEITEPFKRTAQFNLILTGDNHVPFVLNRFVDTKQEGKVLLNPGSLMRQDADQIDYKPAVWFYYAEDNTAVPYYLPIEEGVVTRSHIEKTEERNEMLGAFVSKLNDDWDVSLSFKDNLVRFSQTNKISSKVMDIVYKCVEI